MNVDFVNVSEMIFEDLFLFLITIRDKFLWLKVLSVPDEDFIVGFLEKMKTMNSSSQILVNNIQHSRTTCEKIPALFESLPLNEIDDEFYQKIK